MLTEQPKIIILLGRSGSGKGTQAKLLEEEFGFDYLGTGDLLRQRVKKNDFDGGKIKKILDKGERVPTELVFQLWCQELNKIKNKPNLKGLLIDGSPRSLEEAKLMDGLFEEFGWSNIKVILLDISEQEAFERLTKRRICKKCGRLIPWLEPFKKLKKCDQCGGELETRFDDTIEAIKARLDFYKKDVQPAVDYYQKQKRLIKIDGQRSIEDTYQDIKKAIL